MSGDVVGKPKPFTGLAAPERAPRPLTRNLQKIAARSRPLRTSVRDWDAAAPLPSELSLADAPEIKRKRFARLFMQH